MILLLALSAHAHTLGYTDVFATFSADGTYAVDLRVDPPDEVPDGWLASVEATVPPQAILRFDGAVVTPVAAIVEVPPELDSPIVLRLSGAIPAGAQAFTWDSDPASGPFVVVMQQQGSDLPVSAFLEGGVESPPFPLTVAPEPPGFVEALVTYVVLGFEHILPKGLDHILFVLGLFLLCREWRPLLAQVTAFTLAHSVTLALSMLGILSLPGSVVEPLIALSIACVAVENVFVTELKPWRPAVVFGFGLLHGLGFAGVLGELGMPAGQFVTALVGFNVGVELGQLVVVGAAFLLVGRFWSEDWYRGRIVIPASIAIAAVGLFWTVERTLG